jgi:hypothetical protein
MDYKYSDIVKVAISKYFIEWAEEYLSRGDVLQAKLCFTISLTARPVNKFISLARVVRLGAKIYGLQTLIGKFGAASRRATVDQIH